MSSSKLFIAGVLISLFGFCSSYAMENNYINAAKPESVLMGVIPLETEHYKIAPAHGNNKGNEFVVTSKISEKSYKISGIINLFKTVREIQIISEYMESDDKNHIWVGSKENIKGVGKGLKNIVVHPGDSTVATGKAVGRVARKMGRGIKGIFVRRPKSSNGSSLSDKGDGLTGEYARKFAYEIQIDVYSKNPFVKEFIGSIAFKRWIGRSVSVLPTVVVPGGPLAMSLSSTLGNTDKSSYEIKIAQLPSAELLLWLEDLIQTEMNISKESADFTAFEMFLKNPNFTPRQKAYSVNHLSAFISAPSFNRLLTGLGSAQTIDDADSMFYQLMFLYTYSKRHVRVTNINAYSNRFVGLLENGEIILCFPEGNTSLSKLSNPHIAKLLNTQRTINIWGIGNGIPNSNTYIKNSQYIKSYPHILQNKGFRYELLDYISPASNDLASTAR